MTQKTPFSKPLQPFTNLANLVKMRGVVIGIHSLMDARRVTGLSNREMGKSMAAAIHRRNARGDTIKEYHPATISRMCHPRAKWNLKMKTVHLNAAALVIDEWLKEQLGRTDVRFRMTVNSPWHGWVEIQRECGHWEKFDLRRVNATRCQGCKSK